MGQSRFYARLAAVALLAAFILNFVIPPLFATAKLIVDYRRAGLFSLAGSVNRDSDLRYEGMRGESEALGGLLWQGPVAILLIGYGVYQFIRTRVSLGRVIGRGEFPRIDEHEVADLSAVLRDVASKMSVTISELSLYWIDSGRISPSVLQHKGSVSLFITSGFVVVMASQPLIGCAILAHEFGHILVGDTRLWLFSVSAQTAFGKYGWRAVVPVILASLVVPELWASRFGLIILVWLVGLSFLAYHCSILFLFWARCRSEQIADAIAAHFVGKRALAEAIQLVSVEGSISHIHLSKGQRLAFIDGLE
jgi:hypothetical protein